MKSKMALLMLLICMTGGEVFADASVQVYECVIDGQHVFSDHACGDNAKQREVVVASRMDAVDPKILKQYSKSPKPVHHPSRVTAGDERRQKCTRIKNSKDALEERLKAGFSAKRDERLHDQLRKLDNDYFELRCSSLR